MPASRSVVSVLLRALGEVSLHPQGRPCGRPPPAAVLAPARRTRDTVGTLLICPSRGRLRSGPRLRPSAWVTAKPGDFQSFLAV
jgi:hypothetical protein